MSAIVRFWAISGALVAFLALSGCAISRQEISQSTNAYLTGPGGALVMHDGRPIPTAARVVEAISWAVKINPDSPLVKAVLALFGVETIKTGGDGATTVTAPPTGPRPEGVDPRVWFPGSAKK